jgi:hypothetical protein
MASAEGSASVHASLPVSVRNGGDTGVCVFVFEIAEKPLADWHSCRPSDETHNEWGDSLQAQK